MRSRSLFSSLGYRGLFDAEFMCDERDGLFNALRDPRQRDAVLLRPEPADRIEPGALLAVRDIVLG